MLNGWCFCAAKRCSTSPRNTLTCFDDEEDGNKREEYFEHHLNVQTTILLFFTSNQFSLGFYYVVTPSSGGKLCGCFEGWLWTYGGISTGSTEPLDPGRWRLNRSQG